MHLTLLQNLKLLNWSSLHRSVVQEVAIRVMSAAKVERLPKATCCAGEEFVTQLGMALGGSRNRQAPVVVAATTAGTNSPRLSSFDKADRILLERLVDYDEENCQDLESPLPSAAIPSVCKLLYFRNEVAVTPLTRLFFNLSLHPVTRHFTLGQFLVGCPGLGWR
eukprot:s62_g8.t1